MTAALRILVVEDHPPLSRFIAAVLDKAGWIVIGPIGDHEAALRAAQSEPLDLVLLDRKLQGEDTSAIADALAARGIPCVWMTGYPQSSVPERFRAFPFLEKPFSPDALLAGVRAALGIRSRETSS